MPTVDATTPAHPRPPPMPAPASLRNSTAQHGASAGAHSPGGSPPGKRLERCSADGKLGGASEGAAEMAFPGGTPPPPPGPPANPGGGPSGAVAARPSSCSPTRAMACAAAAMAVSARSAAAVALTAAAAAGVAPSPASSGRPPLSACSSDIPAEMPPPPGPAASDYSRLQLLSYGVMSPQSFIANAPKPVIRLAYIDASAGGELVNYMPYSRRNMRRALQLRTNIECTRFVGAQLLPCGPGGERFSQVWWVRVRVRVRVGVCNDAGRSPRASRGERGGLQHGYDVTDTVQLNAGFNIALTSVIIICLALSSYLFSKDATTYVIVPIETMLKYLKRMIMVGVDGDVDSEGTTKFRKPPETDLLANYVSRLVNEIDNARWKPSSLTAASARDLAEGTSFASAAPPPPEHAAAAAAADADALDAPGGAQAPRARFATTDMWPDSPTGGHSVYHPAGDRQGAGGAAMDREAFLTSPQFKKAMERYTTARSSFQTEEEELVKLLKSLDDVTATAAASAAGLAPGLPTPLLTPPPPDAASSRPDVSAAEAVAAAGVVVPRLAVGLPTAAFKALVLVDAAPSDLKALAVHMHAELGMARALMAAAEADKAAGLRRDMLLKLYGRVLEAPGMSLRDTFAAVLDTLYKVIECDVIKLFVVDHARGQLWPASRHSAADASRGERRIVPFSAADEAAVRDAASAVGLLLMRRRGEMLMACAAGAGGGPAGGGFSVAALPASVARQRLRTVARRTSVVLLEMRHNLWASKQEELMGQARDVLSALQRHCTTGAGPDGPGGLSALGQAGDEALVSYLVRMAGEQGAGRYFNLAHSVGVMQGLYMTLRTHSELAAALGPQQLLALVLAASLLNIAREDEHTSGGPGGTGGGGGGGAAAAAGGVSARMSRQRAAPAGGNTSLAGPAELSDPESAAVADRAASAGAANGPSPATAASLDEDQRPLAPLRTHLTTPPLSTSAAPTAPPLLFPPAPSPLHGGTARWPDSPTGGHSVYHPAGDRQGAGGEAMDREAFLTSPQFKKAMERYTTARSSFQTEEEELVKLLKSLDDVTATAAASAAGLAPGLPTPLLTPPPPDAASSRPDVSAAEAVAAAGVVVPRLAVGLPTAAFKALVLVDAAPSDLKALAVHMHAELGMARALMAAAEADKAAGLRRDMLLKLYGRVLEAPGMSLRDTFAAVLDTLYKVIECDVIKLFVVDHARGQLWPASRHSAADASRVGRGGVAGGITNSECSACGCSSRVNTCSSSRACRAGSYCDRYAGLCISCYECLDDGDVREGSCRAACGHSPRPRLPALFGLPYDASDDGASSEWVVDAAIELNAWFKDALGTSTAVGWYDMGQLMSAVGMEFMPPDQLRLAVLHLTTANSTYNGYLAVRTPRAPPPAQPGAPPRPPTPSPPALPTASPAAGPSRSRGMSGRRGRLAGLVDDVLSGEANLLAALPPAEAAAVKVALVGLLALRSQPAAVLAMPGLHPARWAGGSGGGAAAGGSGRREGEDARGARAGSSGGAPPLASGGLTASAFATANGVCAAAVAGEAGGQGGSVMGAEPSGSVEADVSLAHGVLSVAGSGKSSPESPLSLVALLEAAGSDPVRLADVRAGVSALLLLTWSELLHVQDTATALSLLMARAFDVRCWKSRFAANASSRRRSLVLMVTGAERGGGEPLDDVQSLLLLEVPRLQLEVLPLWQRAADLLPGLAPHVEALQANRLAYMTMLQSAAATPHQPLTRRGATSHSLAGPPPAASNRGRGSLPRNTQAGEPRRFISLKLRPVPAPRGSLGAPPGEADSGDEEAGGGSGGGGGGGRRRWMRATSSRSYAGGGEQMGSGDELSGRQEAPSEAGQGAAAADATGGLAPVRRGSSVAAAVAAAVMAPRASSSRFGFASQPQPHLHLHYASGQGHQPRDGEPSGSAHSFVGHSGGPASHAHDTPFGPAGELVGRRGSVTARLNSFFASFRGGRRPSRPSGAGGFPPGPSAGPGTPTGSSVDRQLTHAASGPGGLGGAAGGYALAPPPPGAVALDIPSAPHSMVAGRALQLRSQSSAPQALLVLASPTAPQPPPAHRVSYAGVPGSGISPAPSQRRSTGGVQMASHSHNLLAPSPLGSFAGTRGGAGGSGGAATPGASSSSAGLSPAGSGPLPGGGGGDASLRGELARSLSAKARLRNRLVTKVAAMSSKLGLSSGGGGAAGAAAAGSSGAGSPMRASPAVSEAGSGAAAPTAVEGPAGSSLGPLHTLPPPPAFAAAVAAAMAAAAASTSASGARTGAGVPPPLSLPPQQQPTPPVAAHTATAPPPQQQQARAAPAVPAAPAVLAPLTSTSLAAQHAQYAAAAAAAVTAFAAQSAAQAASESSSGRDRSSPLAVPSRRFPADDDDSLPPGPAPSLMSGMGPGGALAPVAELTTSGRDSSAATPRAPSAAADTPPQAASPLLGTSLATQPAQLPSRFAAAATAITALARGDASPLPPANRFAAAVSAAAAAARVTISGHAGPASPRPAPPVELERGASARAAPGKKAVWMGMRLATDAELPAGYSSKSMMCVPVLSASHHHLLTSHPSAAHHASAALEAAPGGGDVMAVVVAVNRWTPWGEAGCEEGERRIVPFSAADEAAVRDAASAVGLLLMRRRGEMLMACAAGAGGGPAGGGFSVAALPASVARQRLRTVARRTSVVLLEMRHNLWASKQEELMGPSAELGEKLGARGRGCGGDVVTLWRGLDFTYADTQSPAPGDLDWRDWGARFTFYIQLVRGDNVSIAFVADDMARLWVNDSLMGADEKTYGVSLPPGIHKFVM
ncbi:hypothetical protein TSOC_011397 [Tetrabaena socialis]|uniref:Uncharacterized protein n=1 Tax=Tetrabaena socialis TaxID=47790 RepID=A0A2J7ZQT3_9CHLO|nr:hypothetical protein TSOC_011397 [Tetrabaena socialis]|eukprot:PNH02616.1 hypothetical protein TSOC_011397 [Tetrabaena socialis]